MLVACLQDGTRVIAVDAVRGVDYFCPECNEQVILKRGAVKIAHFAHRHDSTCSYTAEETELHRRAKLEIYRHLQWLRLFGFVSGVQLEWKVGNRRVDVVFDTRKHEQVAIEIQAASIGLDDLLNRTLDISAAGAAVMWVIPVSRLDSRYEVSFRTLVRFCHALYFGGCYYWTPDGLLFARLDDAYGARGQRLKTRKRDEYKLKAFTVPSCTVALPAYDVYASLPVASRRR